MTSKVVLSVVEAGGVEKICLDQEKNVDHQFDGEQKCPMRAEQEPVEAGESNLVAQNADCVDLLLVTGANRSMKSDVLEDPLRFAYLERSFFVSFTDQ